MSDIPIISMQPEIVVDSVDSVLKYVADYLISSLCAIIVTVLRICTIKSEKINIKFQNFLFVLDMVKLQ